MQYTHTDIASHFARIRPNTILYAGGLIKDRLDKHHVFWAYFLNPMATVVSTFQRAIYHKAEPLDLLAIDPLPVQTRDVETVAAARVGGR